MVTNMLKRIFTLFCATLCLISEGSCWLTCSDVEFCVRIRYGEIRNAYSFNSSSTVIINQHSLTSTLKNVDTGEERSITLNAIKGGVFRVQIDDPVNPRHRVPDVLDGEPEQLPIIALTTDNSIIVYAEQNRAVVSFSPFKIQFYNEDNLVAVVNNDGRLIFEDESDAAIALDVFFPGAQRAYGLPEHADDLSLRNTKSEDVDPYRFYNIDNAGYEAYSTQALYGTVPVLYAHSVNGSSGVFWLNSAQTFVDIEKSGNGVDTLFYSESGIIDFFILTGPTLKEAVTQYAGLTGVAPLPPYFTLGYHQSRLYYESTEEVQYVVEEFNKNNFSVDVLWLDGPSGDNFKYFMFDKTGYPDPIALQDYLYENGKRLVAAIEPYTKIDEGYFIYNEALARDYFVKTANNSNFVMDTWNYQFNFMDVFNPEVRDYFSSLYSFDKFNESTSILHVWNDLNEPTIFNSDYERSMPKDNLHFEGWLHRDVHNQYGFYITMASYNGLIDRLNDTQRAFVLTRSHFAGSQRYAAVWTGDNQAQWVDLNLVAPMCLSEALGGISFCGADIGGFLYSPTETLLQRWYQVATWIPFFRQHSNDETDRREPYLYSEDVQERIRYAIQLRYIHLPYWYTTFYEHYRTGEPVIKPLVLQYPTDENVLDMDKEWFVGNDILVSPVLEDNVTQISVYLPGGTDDLWYDIENTLLFSGNGWVNLPVTISTNVYFYRGGSIIPRKETIRSSTAYMHDDPITLYLFLNNSYQASGRLYVDDAISLEYKSNVYLYVQFSFADNVLSSSPIDENASYNGTVTLGNAIIYRPPSRVKGAVLMRGSDTLNLEVKHGLKDDYVEIADINLDLKEDFRIKIY